MSTPRWSPPAGEVLPDFVEAEEFKSMVVTTFLAYNDVGQRVLITEKIVDGRKVATWRPATESFDILPIRRSSPIWRWRWRWLNRIYGYWLALRYNLRRP